jgi:hypothetical protein
MRKRMFLTGAVAASVLLASCGGGSSESSSEESTASTRVKNAALPTTTVAATDTTAAPATTVAAATTIAPATTTPTTVASPTTVLAPTKVKDPGNYQPTYLATTDVAGSPRPALPAEASIATNASKIVGNSYKTDADGVLAVSAAEWAGTTTPLTLRWTVNGKPCDNCAFLSSSAKKVVKALLSANLAGSGITGIRGFDPTAVGVGRYQSNGWGFEVLIGDPASAEAQKTGNAIRDWALNCTGDTASTCRNVDLGIGELRWKNQIWSVADCTSALQNGGPKILLDDATKLLKGANAETASLVRQRAAIDRVAIAVPTYRPVFASTGDARALTGFASTGCAK